MRRAFTLIELLIVVAIIAILAAIAVPNFIEAQTRSKIARAKADMRSIETAVESYAVDNNDYPGATAFDNGGSDSLRTLWSAIVVVGAEGPVGGITTPISYMTTIPGDPFSTFVTSTTSTIPGIPPFLYDKAGFGFRAAQAFPNPGNVWTTIRKNGQGPPLGFVVQLPSDYATAGIESTNNSIVGTVRDIAQTPKRYVLWSSGPSGSVSAIPGHAATTRYHISYRYDPTNGTNSRGFLLRYSGGPSFP